MFDRRVDILLAQFTRDPGQPGAEDEDLDRIETVLHRMDELQQEARVAVHRAGDVADQDQRTHPFLATPVFELDRNPGVLEVIAAAWRDDR